MQNAPVHGRVRCVRRLACSDASCLVAIRALNNMWRPTRLVSGRLWSCIVGDRVAAGDSEMLRDVNSRTMSARRASGAVAITLNVLTYASAEVRLVYDLPWAALICRGPRCQCFTVELAMRPSASASRICTRYRLRSDGTPVVHSVRCTSARRGRSSGSPACVVRRG